MLESLKRISFGALIASCVLVVIIYFGIFRHYLEEKFNGGNEFFVITWRSRDLMPKYRIDYSIVSTFTDGLLTMITIVFGLSVMYLIIGVLYSIGDDFLKKRGDGDTQESTTPISFIILMTAIALGVWVAQLVYLALT